MLEKISLLLLDLWWRIPEATSQPSWRASPMQFAGRHGESGGRSWRGADRAMACGSCGTLWIPLINYHRYGIDGQFSMFLAIENGDLFQFAMLVYQMVNPTNQPCPIECSKPQLVDDYKGLYSQIYMKGFDDSLVNRYCNLCWPSSIAERQRVLNTQLGFLVGYRVYPYLGWWTIFSQMFDGSVNTICSVKIGQVNAPDIWSCARFNRSNSPLEPPNFDPVVHVWNVGAQSASKNLQNGLFLAVNVKKSNKEWWWNN